MLADIESPSVSASEGINSTRSLSPSSLRFMDRSPYQVYASPAGRRAVPRLDPQWPAAPWSVIAHPGTTQPAPSPVYAKPELLRPPLIRISWMKSTPPAPRLPPHAITGKFTEPENLEDGIINSRFFVRIEKGFYINLSWQSKYGILDELKHEKGLHALRKI